MRALSEFRLWSRGVTDLYMGCRACFRGSLATVGAFVATFIDDLDLDVDGLGLSKQVNLQVS